MSEPEREPSGGVTTHLDTEIGTPAAVATQSSVSKGGDRVSHNGQRKKTKRKKETHVFEPVSNFMFEQSTSQATMKMDE